MLLYVAGPFSAYKDANGEYHAEDDNVAEAVAVSARLWELGFTAICPHTNSQQQDDWIRANSNPDSIGWDGWLKGDEEIIARCDGLVMLPNWRFSRGAGREHAFATERGIPIWEWPELPVVSETERRRPIQVKAYMDLIMKGYRTHLRKNADYCVAPGTRILTSDLRWVPVEKLAIRDSIVGFDEDVTPPRERRFFQTATVEDVSDVTLPSSRIDLEDGTSVVCSDEHPWLVKTGFTARWLETHKLQPSDRFQNASGIVKVFEPWETENSYDAGYLAAAFDGEGWLTQGAGTGGTGRDFIVGFAQKDNAMMAEVRRLLDSRGIDYRIKPYKTCDQLILNGRRRLWIPFLGQVRPKRLLSKLDGQFGMMNVYDVKVRHIESVGMQRLIALKSSTGTFLAEGLASHNSPANIAGTGDIGVIVRMWDKMARLLNLTGFRIEIASSTFEAPLEPNNEAIEDSADDISVYGNIYQLNRAGKWGR